MVRRGERTAFLRRLLLRFAPRLGRTAARLCGVCGLAKRRLEDGFLAESRQNIHRINLFADVVWALLSAILAVVSASGLAILHRLDGRKGNNEFCPRCLCASESRFGTQMKADGTDKHGGISIPFS